MDTIRARLLVEQLAKVDENADADGMAYILTEYVKEARAISLAPEQATEVCDTCSGTGAYAKGLCGDCDGRGWQPVTLDDDDDFDGDRFMYADAKYDEEHPPN